LIILNLQLTINQPVPGSSLGAPTKEKASFPSNAVTRALDDLNRITRDADAISGEERPFLQRNFWARNAPFALKDPDNPLILQQMRPPSERTIPQRLVLKSFSFLATLPGNVTTPFPSGVRALLASGGRKNHPVAGPDRTRQSSPWL
jgi:hypothetical protein